MLGYIDKAKAAGTGEMKRIVDIRRFHATAKTFNRIQILIISSPSANLSDGCSNFVE
jgi:hypothetical protein